jgi:hypothetical protein
LSYVDYGFSKKGICHKIGLFVWAKTLGSKNYLSKDGHLNHLLGLDEDGGVHGG